jgi:hypothetical protein
MGLSSIAEVLECVSNAAERAGLENLRLLNAQDKVNPGVLFILVDDGQESVTPDTCIIVLDNAKGDA